MKQWFQLYLTSYIQGAGHGWLGHYPTSLMDAMRKALKCDACELPVIIKFVMSQGAFFKKHFGLHYYAKAMNIRRRLRQAYNKVLTDCDILLMPTLPITATTLPTDGPTDDVIGKIVFSTLSLLRSLLSEGQGCNNFWKTPNAIILVFIG